MAFEIVENYRCDCRDPLHQMEISYYEWNDSPAVNNTVDVALVVTQFRGFWKRLWTGLKYAFNGQVVIVGDICIDQAGVTKMIDTLVKIEARMNRDTTDETPVPQPRSRPLQD